MLKLVLPLVRAPAVPVGATLARRGLCTVIPRWSYGGRHLKISVFATISTSVHKRFNSSVSKSGNEPSSSNNNNSSSKEDQGLSKNVDDKELSRQQRQDTEVSRRIVEAQVKRHIPGETAQTNELLDRVPQFPFSKDQVPTLIPKAGLPRPGSNLAAMVKTLKGKEGPELLYESESHRLYFVFCGAFALVCAIYGLLFLESATTAAWRIYATNEQDLPEAHNALMFVVRNMFTLAVFAFPAGLAALFLTVPTRLIRRIWYLPASSKTGGQELVRFTTHPFLPGRLTPVHTVPLAAMNRSYKTKIFTNKGFYLTLDKGTFLFLLKEGTKRLPWIVDRKGFFWGDGRLFDHLFGKESIEEADLGVSYDDKFGAINKKVEQDVRRLRAEEGPAWQFKEQGKLMKGDLKALAGRIKAGKGKLGSGKTQKRLSGKGQKK